MRKMLMTIMATALLLVGVFAPAGQAYADTITTCEEWTRTALAPHIDFRIDEIVMEDDGLSRTTAPVEGFCNMFRGAIEAELQKPAADQDMYVAVSDPVVHNFMYEGDPYSFTATELGWQKYFDQYHAEGLM